jgi:hypothetical protein
LLWNIILFAVILFTCLFIPLKTSFELQIDENTANYYLIREFPCIIFFFDIFVNFNMGYYEKGTLVTDHIKIFKKYL